MRCTYLRVKKEERIVDTPIARGWDFFPDYVACKYDLKLRHFNVAS